MSERSPIGRLRSYARWVPRVLTGRLIAAILLVASVVTLVTIGVDALLVGSAAAGAAIPSHVHAASHISTMVSALFATVVGALAGLWLSRVSRRPVEQMAERVEEAGAALLEGRDYAGAPVLPGTDLPGEFSDLAVSVEEVLGKLARRQAELGEAVSQAKAAEETLRAMVSASVDPQLLLDGDTVVLANPATALAFNASVDQLAGANLLEILEGTAVTEEDGSPLDRAELLRRALRGPVTIRVVRQGASPKYFAVRAAQPLASMPSRIAVTVKDLTEDLRYRSIRSEITELVTHDLRAPLTVVNGYLDMLRRPLSEEQRAHGIDAAKREAARMAGLLEDLLSATRAEELLSPSELVPVPLPELATEVVASMRTAHPAHSFDLESHGDCQALGDERLLRQALVNLVTNAVRYAPADTPITVAVGRPAARVSVSVVDHGPGIPASQREMVFERYTRLENGNGSRAGLGLGLYIVKVIAESHGGCVRVEETPGGGATFVIDLPRVLLPAEPLEPTAP